MNIYVVSTGRTGTSFLSEQLNAHFQLNLSHQQIGSRVINVVANLPLENSIYLTFLAFLFRLFGRGYPPNSTIDPLLSMAIYKLIKNGRLNPNKCKVVHLVRSPKNFVTSFMNWKRQSFKRTILHHLVPFWNPVPFFHGSSLLSWMKMAKFERFCWVWNYKNSCYSELCDQNYMLLRMEDLFQSETKKQALKELASFLGREVDDGISLDDSNQINKSNPKKFPSFKEWTHQQKQIMHNHCMRLMKIIKYE